MNKFDLFIFEEDPDAYYRRLGQDTQVDGEPRSLVYISQDIMQVLAKQSDDIEQLVDQILRQGLGMK